MWIKKVGERVVTGNEEIADLFHVVQESKNGTRGSNSTYKNKNI
jgi:RNA polymerase-interacting CarD/CdnL/TRCF family regulator